MKVLPKNLETGCCKRFNPKPWEDKELHFENKLFVKDHVFSLFHIPLNYARVMKRNMDKIERAGAKAKESLMLSDESSLWGSDIYIAVEKKVLDLENIRLTGTFLAKVFQGPYKNMGSWIQEMKNYLLSHKKYMKKLYFFYPTCPACAKAYGENYTVLLAEI